MLGFKLSIAASVCLQVSHVFSMVPTGRVGHGLIGYGISMYKPLCAFTCRDVLSSSRLDCSPHMHASEGMEMDMHMASDTSPECYAADNAFLQTLAYCMSTHCQNMATWELERYWNMNAAGKQPNQPVPKATYQQMLASMTMEPRDTLVVGEDLNKTMLISDGDYRASYNAQGLFERMEVHHETYGCVSPWSLELLNRDN